jgi:hypothetical protein
MMFRLSQYLPSSARNWLAKRLSPMFCTAESVMQTGLLSQYLFMDLWKRVMLKKMLVYAKWSVSAWKEQKNHNFLSLRWIWSEDNIDPILHEMIFKLDLKDDVWDNFIIFSLRIFSSISNFMLFFLFDLRFRFSYLIKFNLWPFK